MNAMLWNGDEPWNMKHIWAEFGNGPVVSIELSSQPLKVFV